MEIREISSEQNANKQQSGWLVMTTLVLAIKSALPSNPSRREDGDFSLCTKHSTLQLLAKLQSRAE